MSVKELTPPETVNEKQVGYSIRPGYKQTEVGLIPEDWRIVPLDDAFQIPSGQVDPQDPEYCNQILVAPDHLESRSGRILNRETAKRYQWQIRIYCQRHRIQQDPPLSPKSMVGDV